MTYLQGKELLSMPTTRFTKAILREVYVPEMVYFMTLMAPSLLANGATTKLMAPAAMKTKLESLKKAPGAATRKLLEKLAEIGFHTNYNTFSCEKFLR